MKSFKYSEMDKKLNKKQQKSVNDVVQTNFLKLYEDIPPDPRIDQFCQTTTAQFDQKTINNRYYSYQLDKNPTKTDPQKHRIKQINKMLNFQMGYRPPTRTNQIRKQTEYNFSQIQKHKRQLKQKFRKNIKIIIHKMKKLRINFDQIIKLDVFEKVPYKFGKDIFSAIKEANEEKVWRTLMINKLAIFSLDSTYKTPLIWACIRGHTKIAIMLIEHGIQINKTDLNGFNALFYAIKYNNSECVKILGLNLSAIDDIHYKQSLKTGGQTRNIFNLCVSLKYSLNRLPMEKRQQLLNEQYKYLYEKK